MNFVQYKFLPHNEILFTFPFAIIFNETQVTLKTLNCLYTLTANHYGGLCSFIVQTLGKQCQTVLPILLYSDRRISFQR